MGERLSADPPTARAATTGDPLAGAARIYLMLGLGRAVALLVAFGVWAGLSGAGGR